MKHRSHPHRRARTGATEVLVAAIRKEAAEHQVSLPALARASLPEHTANAVGVTLRQIVRRDPVAHSATWRYEIGEAVAAGITFPGRPLCEEA